MESRYCQTEKEGLAVVWAVEKFEIFLMGRKFELRTDCKALEFIFAQRNKISARLERWVLRLQSFDFLVTHLRGKDNIADTFSRIPIDTDNDVSQEYVVRNLMEEMKPVAMTWKEISEHSMTDPEISAVFEALDDGTWDHVQQYYKNVKEELTIMDGVLLRQNRIVIPMSLRGRVLNLAHEGHPGIVGMKNRLRSKVWYPGIDNDVEKKVKACKDCIMTSLPDPPQPLTRKTLPDEP